MCVVYITLYGLGKMTPSSETWNSMSLYVSNLLHCSYPQVTSGLAINQHWFRQRLGSVKKHITDLVYNVTISHRPQWLKKITMVFVHDWGKHFSNSYIEQAVVHITATRHPSLLPHSIYNAIFCGQLTMPSEHLFHNSLYLYLDSVRLVLLWWFWWEICNIYFGMYTYKAHDSH